MDFPERTEDMEPAEEGGGDWPSVSGSGSGSGWRGLRGGGGGGARPCAKARLGELAIAAETS